MWGLATWIVHKEVRDAPWVFRACLAGLVLLLVQSVFGGLTVLFLLPDLVSTTHLGLALLFLALTSLLESWAVGPERMEPLAPAVAAGVRARSWELGVLRAIGMEARDTRRLVLIEAAWVLGQWHRLAGAKGLNGSE